MLQTDLAGATEALLDAQTYAAAAYRILNALRGKKEVSDIIDAAMQ